MSDSLRPHGCSLPGFPALHYLLVCSNSIELVMPFNYLILCHPLLLLPSVFPSIRVFPNVSALCIRWPNFSFIISPSKEYSVLISFRMDWFDCLAVQGTLKSLIQHHNLKTLILCPSAFFVVQLSYPHMTTGKNIALTRWTFDGKVMPLLFNTLSRFVIALQVSQEFGKVVRYSYLFKNFLQFVVIHTVKGYSVVNEAEVDVFLELLCFFYDTTDIGSSISDSSVLKSAFSLEDLLKHFTLIWLALFLLCFAKGEVEFVLSFHRVRALSL